MASGAKYLKPGQDAPGEKEARERSWRRAIDAYWRMVVAARRPPERGRR